MKYGLFALLLIAALPMRAQQHAAASDLEQKMQWFADAKLGIFIHAGIYSVKGVDESWSFYNKKISHAEYMQQLDGFTLRRYNPAAWADLIQQSGANYAVITTKHHDGVAMYDTRMNRLSSVHATPARQDLVAPLFTELRKRNIKTGAYYSLIDWTHPDYPGFLKDSNRYEIKKYPARWNRFRRFFQGQIDEIGQQLNPDLWWFDGDWEHSAQEWEASKIRRSILARNPAAIINGRLQGYGDYATPEQNFPVSRPPHKWWELCMTINNNWGFQHRDTAWKTPYEVITIFADAVSNGGNLLLDIGPMEDGTIPPQQVQVLEALGDWNRKHERAIFHTVAGMPQGHFYGPTTLSKDSTRLYLFLTGNPGKEIVIKGLSSEIKRISVLGSEAPADWKIVGKISWSSVPGLVYVTVPQQQLDPYLTVLEVQLQQPLKLYRGEGGLSETPPEVKEPEAPYLWPSDPAVSDQLHRWQDWKFGVLMHWGPYSQWGVVESWSLCPEDEPWCERRGPFAQDYAAYVREYEQIGKLFNPQQFNPQRWAEACRRAGMKYLVFTTKHHDGFCMYDSRYTDYKITGEGSVFASDPRSNVVREVFDAFRKQNMGIGAYFSKPDWHNDDYWWPYFPVFDRNVNYNPVKYPERWKRFQDFTYNQIEELMSDYGKLDLLWLDGGWVRPAGSLTAETRPWLGKNQWTQDVNMPAIAAMARQRQPGLLMVDRTVHGEFENYRTPEQQIPADIPDYPWESCITLGDSWYHTGPGERYKSSTWAIHTLARIVAKGGNFLLGVGPDKTGELPPAVYERLEAIGRWMDVHASAIYNTRPLAPYESGKFCFTQSKDGSTRYAIYLRAEDEVLPERMELPEDFVATAKQVTLLGHAGKLKVQEVNGRKMVAVPKIFRQSMADAPALVISLSRGG